MVDGVEEDSPAMPVSFPLPLSLSLSLSMSLPLSWHLPDVVAIWAFSAALGLGHVLFLATVIQLLRKRRFSFLLVALATYAWALDLWSSAADSIAPVRAALGGHQTFVSLNLAAQAIFIGLTLVVIVAAWRRVRAARAAVRLPTLASAAAPSPPAAQPSVAASPAAPVAAPAPRPLPARVIDPDAWLR